MQVELRAGRRVRHHLTHDEEGLVAFRLPRVRCHAELGGGGRGFLDLTQCPLALHRVEELAACDLILGDRPKDAEVALVAARLALAVGEMKDLHLVETSHRSVRSELERLMDGIVPASRATPPEALPVQRDAVVWHGVGHEHALDVVTELRQHRADRSAVLRRDRVVRVRPHEPFAGGHTQGLVTGCGEIVNVRPVVDVEILVNDAVAISRNV